MNRLLGGARAALREAGGLILDDWWLFGGAVLALVVAWAVSRLDPGLWAGVTLLVLVVATLALAVRHASSRLGGGVRDARRRT